MKVILNELPAMSGIPGLDKFNEIKTVISMLKPLASANAASGTLPGR
jgi:hypothetical protein